MGSSVVAGVAVVMARNLTLRVQKSRTSDFGAEILRVWGPADKRPRTLSYDDRNGEQSGHRCQILTRPAR